LNALMDAHDQNPMSPFVRRTLNWFVHQLPLSEERRRRFSLGESTQPRTIDVNDPRKNTQFQLNRIVNTKYTVLTFLPRNLMEQFG
jgi:hypothetical protein